MRGILSLGCGRKDGVCRRQSACGPRHADAIDSRETQQSGLRSIGGRASLGLHVEMAVEPGDTRGATSRWTGKHAVGPPRSTEPARATRRSP